jgi:hypothetical protein
MLFDFSFTEFVTTKIIKFLFALGVIASGIAAVVMLVGGLAVLTSEPLRGIGMIILSPIAFLLYVIGARVYLELIMIIFRIAEHTEEIAVRGRGPQPPQA